MTLFKISRIFDLLVSPPFLVSFRQVYSNSNMMYIILTHGLVFEIRELKQKIDNDNNKENSENEL